MPHKHALLHCCFLLASLAVLAGCASAPPSHPGSGGNEVSFIVVRHAEKANDDPEDPTLTATGRERAGRLATLLADEPITAVYATEFRRTQQTAQPAADQHRVPVTHYFSKGTIAELAAQWLRQHRQGAVLIVGHSNTVPEIVGALSGQNVEPISDSQYNRLYRVDIGADGVARLTQSEY
ncbi:histidine phosphatase family protein [Pseudoxanthomonas sp. UTMC 1351]|uniref:histidine phosphatase family protein n=1 Tax=Pseudoxanthomonas sp. UTMC 1351 TaxID=2695853 RepID=UPI0034CD354A